MRSKKNLLIVITLIILLPILIILALSLYSRIFYFNNIDPEKSNQNIKFNKIIQLDILNGCGEDGLANKARIYLRNRGFDVVEVGNYDSIIDISHVISRRGDVESAKMLSKAIGINDSLLIIDIDSSLSLDCSVVIGKDYKKLKPYLLGE
jgi:hypothetical protein